MTPFHYRQRRRIFFRGEGRECRKPGCDRNPTTHWIANRPAVVSGVSDAAQQNVTSAGTQDRCHGRDVVHDRGNTSIDHQLPGGIKTPFIVDPFWPRFRRLGLPELGSGGTACDALPPLCAVGSGNAAKMSFDSWTMSASSGPNPFCEFAPSDASSELMLSRACVSDATKDICDAGVPGETVDGLITVCVCDAGIPADDAAGPVGPAVP